MAKIASAMMTTDTKPKLAYEEMIVGDELVKHGDEIGMIAPNLATMLSFIFTNRHKFKLLKTLKSSCKYI